MSTDKNLTLDKVYVVIEFNYHGYYREIVEIYANREDADKKIKKLSEKNNNYDIDYFIDIYYVL